MSWRVRSQIKEFQRQHQDQQDPLQQTTTANNRQSTTNNTTTASKPKSGDYIDFEEVKD
jgi:hypothetical protein